MAGGERISKMGSGLAFQKYPHNSEVVLENSGAKRLLTSHRYNCDIISNTNDMHLTVLIIEVSQRFMPKRSLNGL